MLMTACEYLRKDGSEDRERIREAISGNLCRCTGYETIVDAIAIAARRQAKEPK
jgi:carbon-monoxide dehydrogenase small subunit